MKIGVSLLLGLHLAIGQICLAAVAHAQAPTQHAHHHEPACMTDSCTDDAHDEFLQVRRGFSTSQRDGSGCVQECLSSKRYEPVRVLLGDEPTGSAMTLEDVLTVQALLVLGPVVQPPEDTAPQRHVVGTVVMRE